MNNFIGSMLGGKADSMVEKVVDTAAGVAKEKLKEVLGGESNSDENQGGGGGGGIGKLLSLGGKSENEGSGGGDGGGIGSLLSFGSKSENDNSGGDQISFNPTESSGGGGGGGDFMDALGDVAAEMADGK